MNFERIPFNSIVGLSDEEVFYILHNRTIDLMKSYAKNPEDIWNYNCELVGMVPFEYRIFILGITLDREISNGGFIQYFSNHLGSHNVDTLDALKTVGAMGMYEVFQKAVEKYSQKSNIFLTTRYEDKKSIELNCDIDTVENPELKIFEKYDVEYDYCDEKPLCQYFVEYAHTNKDLYFI